MNSLETLPWWIKGLIVGVALAILVAVVHWLPPQWAWIALGLAVAAVAFFLLFNPRYRFLRLSSRALQLWLGVRAIGSLSLFIWWGEERWAFIELAGDPPWSFDISMAAVVLGFGLIDFFKDGGFSMRLNKVGPVKDNSGNVANLIAGDHSPQSVTQVARDQITTHVHVDPNKTIGEAEEQLKNRLIDVTVFMLEGLKRDHPGLLTPAQKLRIAKALAGAYLIRDDYEKAAEQYFDAKEHAPNDRDAAVFEGLGHWLLSEQPKALNLADAVLNDDPQHEEAWFLAIVAERDPASADAFLATVPKQHRKKLNILSALVLRAVMNSEWDAAIAFADQLLECDADNVMVKQASGRAYAASSFDSWMDRHSRPAGDVNRLASQAVELLTAGLADKAIGPVSRSDLFYHRSLANRVLNLITQSEADMIAAREHQPHNPKLIFQHCIFLIHEDRLDDALDLLNTISGRSLDDGPGLVLARLLFRAARNDAPKEADRAEQILLDVLDNNEDEDPRLTYEPLELLCTELTRRGSRDRAEQHLQTYSSKLEPVGQEAVDAAISLADEKFDEAKSKASNCYNAVSDSTPPIVSVFVCKLLSDLQLDDEAADLLSRLTKTTSKGFITDLALEVGNRSKNLGLVLDVAQRLRVQDRPTVRSAELEIGVLESLNEFDEAISVIDQYIQGLASGLYFVDESSELREAFAKVLTLRRTLLGIRLDRPDLIDRSPESLPGLVECGKEKPLALDIACLVAKLLSDGDCPQLGHEMAVQIFRENHDAAIAHQCLVQVCGPSSEYEALVPSSVCLNSAVCFFDEGTQKLDWRLIVEDAPKRSQQEWPKDHPLAQAMMGKKVGDRYIDDSDPLSPQSGVIQEIRDATQYRVMDAMQKWRERFGDPTFLRQFKLETPDGKFDFEKWVQLHEQLNEPIENAKRVFRHQLPSISFFATATGRLIVEATGHFASQRSAVLQYGDGSVTERDRAAAAWKTNKPIVIDPTSLATLFTIGANQKLSKLGANVKAIISAGTIEELRAFYRNPHSRLHSQRIGGAEGGKPFYIEYDDETIQKNIAEFKSFVEWIEDNAEIIGGRSILNISTRIREPMTQMFGTPVVESLVIAAAKGGLLVSDDLCVEQFPELSVRPEKVNSLHLLQHLALIGGLTEQDRVELFHRLIAFDYRFTPLDQGVIGFAAERAEWKADDPNLRCIIDWLHSSGASDLDAAGAGAAIIAVVWRGCILADRRSLAIREVARSLARHGNAFSALSRLQAELSNVFASNDDAMDEARESIRIAKNRRSIGELIILPGHPDHFLPREIARNLRART